MRVWLAASQASGRCQEQDNIRGIGRGDNRRRIYANSAAFNDDDAHSKRHKAYQILIKRLLLKNMVQIPSARRSIRSLSLQVEGIAALAASLSRLRQSPLPLELPSKVTRVAHEYHNPKPHVKQHREKSPITDFVVVRKVARSKRAKEQDVER